MKLRPFFGYYGSKWGLAKMYPSPRYDSVVEPFAGSAGYSCNHPDRKVLLVEKDATVVTLWRYLINVKPSEIMSLPDIREGETVGDLPVCEEAKILIGFWLHKQAVKPRDTVSSWMVKHPKGGFWGQKVRERIAEQVEHIRHWKVIEGDYDAAGDAAATWFIDPPYSKNGKKYVHRNVDYERLAKWCKTRPGQQIVCEEEGADWLPFEPLGSVKSVGGKHRGSEVVYYGQLGARDARSKPGTDEWIQETSQIVRLQLRAVEGDCRIVAERIPKLREAVFMRGRDWDEFCRESIGTAADFIDRVIEGIRILRKQGHTGPANSAEAVKAHAEAAIPLPAHGDVGRGRDNPTTTDRGYKITSIERGTSSAYLAARIARDAPEILERMRAGEFTSVRKAAIEAGVITLKTRPEKAMTHVRRMTPAELSDFEERFGDYLEKKGKRDAR